MNLCSIRLVLIFAFANLSFASIETETKYTLITSPGNKEDVALSRPEEMSTAVINQDDSSYIIPDRNQVHEDVSINVLQNGKIIFMI